MSNLLKNIWSIFRSIFPFYDNNNKKAIIDCDTKELLLIVDKKEECEIWDEIMLNKRNLVRRNSKRFVIGDGEDEINTTNQLPDVTINECSESENNEVHVRNTEWAHGNRLVPGTTLT